MSNSELHAADAKRRFIEASSAGYVVFAQRFNTFEIVDRENRSVFLQGDDAESLKSQLDRCDGDELLIEMVCDTFREIMEATA
jgi:hypothetical protein